MSLAVPAESQEDELERTDWELKVGHGGRVYILVGLEGNKRFQKEMTQSAMFRPCHDSLHVVHCCV